MCVDNVYKRQKYSNYKVSKLHCSVIQCLITLQRLINGRNKIFLQFKTYEQICFLNKPY